jgi:hypothetical protein
MHRACKTLGTWLVVAAMLSAVGGHWALLQSVAWTGMIVENARRSDLGRALEQTFDGRHPCPLCQSIEKGRKSQREQDTQAPPGKLDLIHEAGDITLFSHWEFDRRHISGTFAQARPHRPLLEPPRLVVA